MKCISSSIHSHAAADEILLADAVAPSLVGEPRIDDGLLESDERFLEQVVALGGLAQGIREFLGAFLVRSLPLYGVGGFGFLSVKIRSARA
jgi:hypothetical protein